MTNHDVPTLEVKIIPASIAPMIRGRDDIPNTDSRCLSILMDKSLEIPDTTSIKGAIFRAIMRNLEGTHFSQKKKEGGGDLSPQLVVQLFLPEQYEATN
ncbi:MAG: hypothetical protein ACW987_17670 [Candidatus Thorarchaeota archaeon]